MHDVSVCGKSVMSSESHVLVRYSIPPPVITLSERVAQELSEAGHDCCWGLGARDRQVGVALQECWVECWVERQVWVAVGRVRGRMCRMQGWRSAGVLWQPWRCADSCVSELSSDYVERNLQWAYTCSRVLACRCQNWERRVMIARCIARIRRGCVPINVLSVA